MASVAKCQPILRNTLRRFDLQRSTKSSSPRNIKTSGLTRCVAAKELAVNSVARNLILAFDNPRSW